MKNIDKLTREELISVNKHIFWHIPDSKKKDISNEVLVEYIFNFGQWHDIKNLCQVLGYQELKRIYSNLSERSKNNYFKPYLNLFGRIVERYA